jgi:hypothetical protein
LYQAKKTVIFEVLLSSKTTVYNIMFGVELNQSNLRTVAHNLLFPRNTGNQLPVPPAVYHLNAAWNAPYLAIFP